LAYIGLLYLALLCLVSCREDILLSPVVGVLDAFNALGSLDAAPVDAVLADEVRDGAHKCKPRQYELSGCWSC